MACTRLSHMAAIAAATLVIMSCQEATQPDVTDRPMSSQVGSQVVPDRYIVIFKDDVADPVGAARGLAGAQGLELRHTYATALKGFAATIPEARLRIIASDPRVQLVEPDGVHVLDAQTLPTGIDRIETDKNPTAAIGGGGSINLDVAIIDSGIDGSHPDLNVQGGENFANGPVGNWDDGNGHGTHVAGTVGAIDNGSGVVGVAPGVRLWAVRVCGNSGFCFTSDMVAGMDWVAQQKSTNAIDFAAANMSISTADDSNACNGSSDAVHRAICGLVETGVVFVMAAGNDGREKHAYPEALAVSAIADFDGKGGGTGSATCRADQDDTLAGFSNWGPDVDIAAPGVCIYSTYKGGGYATLSGTSMASPHATGAVALYLAANGLTPATSASGVSSIRNAIESAGLAESSACSYTNEHAADGSTEPMLFVNATAFGGDGTCDDAGASQVHDVAVTGVSASPNPATQGDQVTVSVTVANQGDFTETFDIGVTESPDNANLGSQNVTLAAGASTSLDFSWSTTTNTTTNGHTLTAQASVVSGESDTADNSGSTTVTVNAPAGGSAPTVSACNPDKGSPNDQLIVTVSGSGFQNGATADFGDRVMVQSVTFASSTALEVAIKVHPRATSGFRTVTVTNPDGQTGSLDTCFVVN